MPALNELMALAQFQQQQADQADPLKNALRSLAGGFQQGQAERKAKLEKQRQEDLFFKASNDGAYSSAGKAQNLADKGRTDVKIKKSYDLTTGKSSVKLVPKDRDELFQQAVDNGLNERDLRSKFADKKYQDAIDSLVLNKIIGNESSSNQEGVSLTPRISGSGSLGLAKDPSNPKPGEEVLKGRDALGRSLGTTVVKKSAAQDKRDVEIGELQGQILNLIDSYKGARSEVGDISGIGERGIKGRLAGVQAVVKGKLGDSPRANVFQDRRKAFATTVAKAAGEQRPTDEDINRFLETLPSLSKNDEENAVIIDSLIAELQAKGASDLWAERAKDKASIGGNSLSTPSGVNFTFEEIK